MSSEADFDIVQPSLSCYAVILMAAEQHYKRKRWHDPIQLANVDVELSWVAGNRRKHIRGPHKELMYPSHRTFTPTNTYSLSLFTAITRWEDWESCH